MDWFFILFPIQLLVFIAQIYFHKKGKYEASVNCAPAGVIILMAMIILQ